MMDEVVGEAKSVKVSGAVFSRLLVSNFARYYVKAYKF